MVRRVALSSANGVSGAPTEPVTRRLAAWSSSVGDSPLPEPVRRHARRALLDHLAATVAGSESAPAVAVASLLRDTEGSGPATVVGTGLRLSPANAAFANGTAAHALEVDDGYTAGSFHPGAAILPAVLAVAEALRSSPEQLVRAVAVGYEVGCRIASAGHPATWRRGFHNTSVAGVFGAAAGVASLYELDAEVTASALGVAGSHASGLFEFLQDGTDVKRLHAGKAARDGVLSTELARRGLSGPSTVLEGPQGYFQAYGDGRADVVELVADLGTRWHMLDTYFKPHACCRHLHGPIDAVLALAREEPIDLDAITAIEVGTYRGAARHAEYRSATILDAQMSIPYAVAVALRHGEVGVTQFAEAARRDRGVDVLADKVSVHVSPECDRDYPDMRPAEVTIRTASGERRVRIDQPLGEPANPLDDAELHAKVHRLCDPHLGSERTRELIDTSNAASDAVSLLHALNRSAPA